MDQEDWANPDKKNYTKDINNKTGYYGYDVALAIVVLDRLKDSSRGIIDKIDDKTKKRTNLFQFPKIQPFRYEEVSDNKLTIPGYPF